jgi:hypothetical protein
VKIGAKGIGHGRYAIHRLEVVLAPHDHREHERLAPTGEIGGELKHLGTHPWPPSWSSDELG